MQGDQFRAHQHGYSYVANAQNLQPAYDSGAARNGMAQATSYGANTAFQGGAETHPPNVYVLYFVYLGRPATQVASSEEELRTGKPPKLIGDKSAK
jgi:hypothetical protein